MRKLDLFHSIHVLHAYIQYLQYDRPLPKPLNHWQLGIFRKAYEVGLFEWALDTILREIILNAEPGGKQRLHEQNFFATLCNQLRDIENEVWGSFPQQERDIFLELHRIIHRQYPWQQRIHHATIARYYKIYSQDGISEIFRQVHGMNVREWFQITLALAGHFHDTPISTYPLKNQINNVDTATVGRFISKFSDDLPNMKKRTADAQSYDVNWSYIPSPLRETPLLLRYQKLLYCPIPTHFLRRSTDGLFYDLVNRPHFGDAYGRAVQNYAGDVLDNLENCTVYEEFSYYKGKDRKDTVDWIAEDDGATLFLEIKSKRLKLIVKTDINAAHQRRAEIDKMASFICQIYKTINDAKANLYTKWNYIGKPIYPVVVTLDEWHFFGDRLLNPLNEVIKSKLSDYDIDISILDEHPYSIISLEELEILVHHLNSSKIDDIFSSKTTGEHRLWSLEAFLKSFQPQQPLSPHFPKVWDDILQNSK